MTPQRKKRLALVALIVMGVGVSAALALSAFRENMLFFFSPSQILAGEAPTGYAIRIGGLVGKGSVQRQPGSLKVRFVVTDTVKSIPVVYSGILPDLFREGQGIVALGRLGSDGVFTADEVLAKHNEKYMPPEVKQAIATAQGGGTMRQHPGGRIE